MGQGGLGIWEAPAADFFFDLKVFFLDLLFFLKIIFLNFLILNIITFFVVVGVLLELGLFKRGFELDIFSFYRWFLAVFSGVVSGASGGFLFL